MSERGGITAADWQTTVTAIGRVGGWFVQEHGSNVNSETHLMKKDGIVLVLFAKLAVGKPKSNQHARPWQEWELARRRNDNIYLAWVTPSNAEALWACLVENDALEELEDDER